MKNLIFALLITSGLSNQAFSENLQNYEGSSFREVIEVLTDLNPTLKSLQEIEEFKIYQAGNLPVYPVNSLTVFGTNTPLIKDAQRTLNERFDYYDYLPKKLHPNGVCVTGEWEIDKASAYSGYFKQGSKALFIGRISVTMGSVARGEKRGFGFAGKIFPTMDENAIVKTANFFSVDVLLGTKLERVLDARMTNQPETGFKFSMLGLALKIASTFKQADQDPTFRPLTPIAKLGESGLIKTPRWFRLSAVASTLKNHQSDFRNEILKAFQDNKEVAFNIDATDIDPDRNAHMWSNLGKIRLTRALASFACDRKLHFAHPRMKE